MNDKNTIQFLKIDKYSSELKGIARNEGKVIFVSGAIKGEEVSATITKKSSNFDEALVSEIFTPSPDRVSPACPIAMGSSASSICGGCQLQFLGDKAQIEAKQDLLKELFPILKDWGEPILGDTTGYRGKARIGVHHSHRDDRVLIGFNEINSNRLVDAKACLILQEKIGSHLSDLADFINSLPLKKHIPHIEVATSYDNSGFPRISLVFRVLKDASAYHDKFREFGKKMDYDIFLQAKGLDSIYSINGVEYLSYELPKYDIKIFFKPADFTQVNYKCNLQMIDQAIAYLEPSENDVILDLFAGAGNFSLPMARFSRTISVEGEPAMTSRCVLNALKNGLSDKIDALTFDLAQPESVGLLATKAKSLAVNKILLDPPRSGAAEVINSLVSVVKPEVIVYVSCNPTTLKRDAERLLALGYEAVNARFVNMFHHTSHIETIMHFILKK